jgi:hypothetical protein
VVGIGYDAAIAAAQQVALDVLHAHPSALDTPQRKAVEQDSAAVSTAAEGDLRSEASDLQNQVKHEDVPEQGQDLLTQYIFSWQGQLAHNRVID